VADTRRSVKNIELADRYSGESNRRNAISPNKEVSMNSNNTPIFDLSPAEKLQLVEDLWGDLAANPSEIPVADWQKEELARRKANLRSKPASGLSWDEVKSSIRRRFGH
jgi:putative addiction module component (TIGR02574 family)